MASMQLIGCICDGQNVSVMEDQSMTGVGGQGFECVAIHLAAGEDVETPKAWASLKGHSSACRWVDISTGA